MLKLSKFNIILVCLFLSILIISSSCGEDKNADEWFKEGRVMEKEGNLKGAIKCYSRAIKLDPKNLLYWNTKGLTLANTGDFKTSLWCFEKALRISPEDENTLANKEFVLIMSKKEK